MLSNWYQQSWIRSEKDKHNPSSPDVLMSCSYWLWQLSYLLLGSVFPLIIYTKVGSDSKFFTAFYWRLHSAVIYPISILILVDLKFAMYHFYSVVLLDEWKMLLNNFIWFNFYCCFKDEMMDVGYFRTKSEGLLNSRRNQ